MLTKRQAECHRFIFEFSRHNGRSPICEEIAAGLNLKAKSNATRFCRQLEERGILLRGQRNSWRDDPQRTRVLLKKPPLHRTAYFKAVQPGGEDQKLVLMEKR